VVTGERERGREPGGMEEEIARGLASGVINKPFLEQEVPFSPRQPSALVL